MPRVQEWVAQRRRLDLEALLDGGPPDDGLDWDMTDSSFGDTDDGEDNDVSGDESYSSDASGDNVPNFNHHRNVGDHGNDDVDQFGDGSSDSDVVVLDEAPSHMRRETREGTPITISSDEDEDVPLAGSSKLKRKHIASGSARGGSGSPRKKRVRVSDIDSAIVNAVAGPSNHRARQVTEEAESEPGDKILPKATYLIPVVLEIIPDLDPQWIQETLERVMNEIKENSSTPGQDAIDHVINMALEMDEYPKAGGDKGKGKAADKEEGDYTDPTYRAQHRTGMAYNTFVETKLSLLFPKVPVSHIRTVLWNEGAGRLVPSYLILQRQGALDEKPYKELKKGRNAKGKGRQEEEADVEGGPSDNGDGTGGATEARREAVYLQNLIRLKLEKDLAEQAAQQAVEEEKAAKAKKREEAIANGNSMECGCCFDDDVLDDMVACPGGHMFCSECVTRQAETKLGEQQVTITCMDMSGCKSLFTDAILATVLSEKTMSLYHRLRQLKDLELAAIEGLETCPHCPYAVVIENEHEKLFNCQNPDCMQVTCRQCKRPNHIPRRCEEVETDLKLDKRHSVEEAMSAALMRKCPTCAKAYVKELGCNKIVCQSCGTISCYVCQKSIPEGYRHFDQTPPGHPPHRGQPGKCRLWDTNEAHADAERVREARDNALQRVRDAAAEEGVALDDADINVEAPVAGPAARRHAGHAFFPLAVDDGGYPAVRMALDIHGGLHGHMGGDFDAHWRAHLQQQNAHLEGALRRLQQFPPPPQPGPAGGVGEVHAMAGRGVQLAQQLRHAQLERALQAQHAEHVARHAVLQAQRAQQAAQQAQPGPRPQPFGFDGVAIPPRVHFGGQQVIPGGMQVPLQPVYPQAPIPPLPPVRRAPPIPPERPRPQMHRPAPLIPPAPPHDAPLRRRRRRREQV